jgi:ribonuclease BN (tRNA processing enzyme)
MKKRKHRTGRLDLTTRGNLSLFFLGTGSAFAKILNQNNLLVIKGKDHILIDCGNKCSQALHERGIQVPDIQNYLITHSHADHVGGLEEVMMCGRYIARKKPNMVITTEYEKILWEQSLMGGAAHSETGAKLKFKDFWHVIRPSKKRDFPRETWEANIGSINLKMPRTMHIPDRATSWEDSFWSCGLIVDDRVLYSSDTRFDPDLIMGFEDRFNFDVIFHDCQFFNGGVHASLEELSTLPQAIKKKMILMHYGDEWQQYRQQAKAAGFHSFAEQGASYNFTPVYDPIIPKIGLAAS